MKNLSLKHKFFAVFIILILVIFISGAVILHSLSTAAEDAEIINALGRQRMLTQEMAQSVFGYSMAKSQKKTLEQQIKYLDSYITEMRKIYTQSVIEKYDFPLSMDPASEPHPTIPFPATFTRMVNESFEEKNGFSATIISEDPMNPDQNLRSEFDKEANRLLNSSSEPYFSKILEEDGKLTFQLYSADRATTTACVSCHSALQNKKVKLGDVLGIRSYKQVYSENIGLGNAELNVNLNQYVTAKTMFEFTLLVIKLGGEMPLDRNLSQWKKVHAIADADAQNKISEIENVFHELVEDVETILELETNSIPFRLARQDIIEKSNNLRDLSSELTNLYEKIAKKNHRNITHAVAMTGIATLIILICLGIYINRIVIKPVLEISRILTDTATGNLKQKKRVVSSKDEIGILNQSCNQLVQGLQIFIECSENILKGKKPSMPPNLKGDFNDSLERMKVIQKAKEKAEEDLRHAHDSLELRIKERTSELEESNKTLKKEISLRTESETRAQVIVETAPDAFIGTDSNGKIIEWNIQAEQAFGWSSKEALGQTITELIIPPAYREAHLAGMNNFLKTGKRKIVSGRIELSALNKDGNEFPIEISLSPIRLGNDYHFNAFIRDISEQKQMQTQLNHSQKMESIGQLAAGMAHEINTPMQFIGDNTRFLEESFHQLFGAIDAHDRLRKECKKGTVSEKVVQQVESSLESSDMDYLSEEIPLAIKQSLEGVERVTKIIKAMKEFSHPGSEEKVSMDINQAIETTLTVARNEWKYIAEIEKDFDPGLPPVPCFANDFNQVILNVVVNAAHAIAEKVKNSGDKGTIAISTKKDGDWAEIRIQDNGPGIPESIQSKIFDPFFTTKEVGKGTGQGLSIVHSIVVKKHGGTVNLETDEGKGTTFIFRFPISANKD